MLAKIERRIQESGERVIPSHKFGAMILERLHEIDKVAYVRFASVYKDFKDTSEFLHELESLDKTQDPSDININA